MFHSLWSYGPYWPGSSVHGFSRQEHWSGLPGSPPGDLPNPGIKPSSLLSPALAGGFFTTSITWGSQIENCIHVKTLTGFPSGSAVRGSMCGAIIQPTFPHSLYTTNHPELSFSVSSSQFCEQFQFLSSFKLLKASFFPHLTQRKQSGSHNSLPGSKWSTSLYLSNLTFYNLCLFPSAPASVYLLILEAHLFFFFRYKWNFII